MTRTGGRSSAVATAAGAPELTGLVSSSRSASLMIRRGSYCRGSYFFQSTSSMSMPTSSLICSRAPEAIRRTSLTMLASFWVYSGNLLGPITKRPMISRRMNSGPLIPSTLGRLPSHSGVRRFGWAPPGPGRERTSADEQLHNPFHATLQPGLDPLTAVVRGRAAGTGLHEGAHADVGLLFGQFGDVGECGRGRPVDGPEGCLAVDPQRALIRCGILRSRRSAAADGHKAVLRGRMPGEHVDRRRGGELSGPGAARAVRKRFRMLFQDGGKVQAVGEAELQHLRAVGDAAARPEDVVAQFPQFGAGPAAVAQRGQLVGVQRTGGRDVRTTTELPCGPWDALGGDSRPGQPAGKGRGEGTVGSRRRVAADEVGGAAHQSRGGSDPTGNLHREAPGPRLASLRPLRRTPRPGYCAGPSNGRRGGVWGCRLCLPCVLGPGGQLPRSGEQPGGEVVAGGGHGGTAQPLKVLAFPLLPDAALRAARQVPPAPLLGLAGKRRCAKPGTPRRAAEVPARKATQ